jgi:hypothetical protein
MDTFKSILKWAVIPFITIICWSIILHLPVDASNKSLNLITYVLSAAVVSAFTVLVAHKVVPKFKKYAGLFSGAISLLYAFPMYNLQYSSITSK